ncbi:MAG: hypothetical protein V4773_14790 [Verrucomicrobiota bacterium]
MKRALPLVPVLAALFFGGCANGSGTVVNQQAPGVFSNTAAFDHYVEQRSSSLLLLGATKNRTESESQARMEAERRYGPRATVDSASIGYRTGSSNRSLKMSEIDSALAKARD